ncbi:MAG: alanine/glycine:cation symporter family protein [Bacteroidales bacterium]
MEMIHEILTVVNDYWWSYILIPLLVGCALWFSYKTKFVQFRLIGEMFKVLGGEDKDSISEKHKNHISSFQAFSVSMATRVGTGNLAGVATAIVVGGPGAIFWMWFMALIGSANSFIESTLAQAYKRKGEDSFIGGPAYYMERGLNKRWFGIIFAVLITITFGFAFNSVQSNTICAAINQTFNVDATIMGPIITVMTLLLIFGGIHRIAKFSSVVVTFMALAYIVLALFIVLMNITAFPSVIKLIVSSAMGMEQVAGGAIGAAVMQGVRRGLFSNEAGMGSSPNAAATANISHPVKQGLIQTLGVFVDTIFICTCTAAIILFSGLHIDGTSEGINLTQNALTAEIGNLGGLFITIAVFLFAFTSILGNYYYGENNIRFITKNKTVMFIYRLCVGGMVLFGSMTTMQFAWDLSDLTMGLMATCNLIALIFLGRQAVLLLNDYMAQRKAGIKNPVFKKKNIPELSDKLDLWD